MSQCKNRLVTYEHHHAPKVIQIKKTGHSALSTSITDRSRTIE